MPGFRMPDLRPHIKQRGFMFLWNGTERRESMERRKEERRRSMRYTADTLVVIEGVTWIDNEGTDRRRKVRRRQDRERLARIILEDVFL
jgi:hypothetical protein